MTAELLFQSTMRRLAMGATDPLGYDAGRSDPLYKHIPWSDMAKMRDKITHFYFGVDHEVVWKVIKERFPALKQQIEEIVKEQSS